MAESSIKHQLHVPFNQPVFKQSHHSFLISSVQERNDKERTCLTRKTSKLEKRRMRDITLS